MKTQFVIKFNGGYYRGLDFTNDINLAMKFDSREEADKRCKLRSDWTVERIEDQKGYAYEKIFIAALLMFLLVFSGTANAQVFTQQFTTTAITSQNVIAVASGDFRSKGYADLVTASNTQVCVYQNDGTGHFNLSAPNCFVFGSGLFVQGMGVGDFNGDGKLDIVAFGQGFFGGAYTFLNGDGTGNFSGGSGFTSNDLINSGSGGTSGPIVGPFASAFLSNTTPQFAMAAQDCVRSTTIVQIAGSLTSGEASFPGCTDVLVGAIGFTGYLQSKGNTTGYTLVATQQGGLSAIPFTYCNNASIATNGYIVGYGSNGSVCVEQSSGSTVGAANITLTGTQAVQSIIPVNISNGQSGILALLQNGSLSLLYGADVLHLTSQVNISGPTNPTFAVADIFRATGAQNSGQDFIVVNSTGLTVFVQGIFDGVFSPTSYTFSAQAIGTSASKQFTFVNAGTGPITPIQISVAGSSDYSQTNSCPQSLPVGGTCPITVLFLPGVPEVSSSATLSLTSTLVNKSVALTGTEVLFGKPEPAQSSVTFTNQLVNTNTSQTVSIFNGGNEAFAMSASTVAPYSQSNNCNSVQPQTSCNLIVTYAPSALGTQTGSVNLTFDTASAQTISLTGNGVAAPSVTTPVTNQTAVAGSTANFSVTVSGTAPISYVWKLSGNIIGGNTSTLSFTTTASENQNQVSVTATNLYGSVTSSAVLTVLTVPVISSQPANTSVTLGQTASFSVAATGSSPLHFAWSLGTVAAGTDSSTFTTPATTASNNGAIVKVVVSNSAGSTTSANAILTVDFPSSITTQPTNQTVTLTTPTGTATATFSLVAQGTNNSYQWIRNSVPISGTNSPTFSFAASAVDNGDTIQCSVSGPFGPTVLSNTVTLTVNVPPTATAVSQTSINVGVNQITTFQIKDTGTAPTVVWSKAGVVVAGASGTSYTTPALQTADDRSIWTAVVSNLYGTASVNFQTNVISPPVVTAQSQNPSIVVGQSASFSVNYTTNDGAPATFAWTHNGQSVSNTTQSFTISSAVASDTGTVQLVITDLGGSTTVTWQFTVSAASVSFALSPATQTISAGQSASYSMSILNNTGSALTLKCSTTVPAATCNFGGNPSEVLTTGFATVTVVTTASSALPLLWLGTFLAGLVAFVTRPQYRRKLVPVMATCIILLALGGCAGGSATPTPQKTPAPSPSPTPTPTGTAYVVTVTATGQNVFQSSTATLVIQ